MKKLFSMALVVLTAALVNSVFAFAKYVDITIQNYTGNEVANFPVLVKIDATKIPGVYTDVKNAGADMKFTDATGVTEYPYDVDVWDPTGTSLVWVKVPNLANGATFRMYYGDATQTVNEGSANVWSAYHGVWHLNDLADAGGVYGLTAVNTAGVTDGQIGSGHRILKSDAASTKEGALWASADIPVVGGFTISLWMKHEPTSGNYNADEAYFAKVDTMWHSNKQPIGFLVKDNTSGWSGRKADFSNGDSDKALNIRANECGNFDGRDGQWHFYTFLWDGSSETASSLNVYIDGKYSQTVSGTSNNHDSLVVRTSDMPLVFGNYSNTDSSKIGTANGAGNAWNGVLDEVRVNKSVTSVDYAKAEYLVATTDVTTFGEPQEAGPTVQVLPQGVIVK